MARPVAPSSPAAALPEWVPPQLTMRQNARTFGRTTVIPLVSGDDASMRVRTRRARPGLHYALGSAETRAYGHPERNLTQIYRSFLTVSAIPFCPTLPCCPENGSERHYVGDSTDQRTPKRVKD